MSVTEKPVCVGADEPDDDDTVMESGGRLTLEDATEDGADATVPGVESEIIWTTSRGEPVGPPSLRPDLFDLERADNVCTSMSRRIVPEGRRRPAPGAECAPIGRTGLGGPSAGATLEWH